MCKCNVKNLGNLAVLIRQRRFCELGLLVAKRQRRRQGMPPAGPIVPDMRTNGLREYGWRGYSQFPIADSSKQSEPKMSRTLRVLFALLAVYTVPSLSVAALAYPQPLSTVDAANDADIAQVAPLHEIWLVSARTIGACEDVPRLAYWRYEHGAWVTATQEELCNGPLLPTCVWSHGNWVSHYDAAVIGWKVYKQIKHCGHNQPFRMIIWSWPTDRQGKVRKDAQAKSIRADKFAYPLAWLVNKFPAGQPVSFVGFSYGAKLNAGALHLLGGGSKGGRYLEATDGPPRPARGIFLAAAMDNFSLAPNEQNGLALPFAQKIVNLYNARDKVLDFYPLLWRWGGPKAAGRTGLVGYGGPFASKIFEMNVARTIGPKHEWERYFYSSVVGQIAEEALFVDMAILESVDPGATPEPTTSESAVEVLDGDVLKTLDADTIQPADIGPALTFPAGQ